MTDAITESVKRPTEQQSNRLMQDKQGRRVLIPAEELVLRAELSILIDERFMNIRNFLEVSSITKEREAVVQEIAKRLRLDKETVRRYLNRIYHVFKAAEANGDNLSALPYVGKPKTRGKGKKNKVPKQGRKRPILGYASIAEAARETGESYQWLQKNKALRENSL